MVSNALQIRPLNEDTFGFKYPRVFATSAGTKPLKTTIMAS